MVPESSYRAASLLHRGRKFGTLGFPALRDSPSKSLTCESVPNRPISGTLNPKQVRNFSAKPSVSEIFTPKTTVPTACGTVPIGHHGDAIHTDSRNFGHR